MAYKKTDLIYILSTKLGYIPPLRQIGPIVNPLRVNVYTAYKCLVIGVPISQFDPETGLVIKLTTQNLYDDTKFQKLAEEISYEKNGESPRSDEITDNPVKVKSILEEAPAADTPASNTTSDEVNPTTEYTAEQQTAYEDYISQGFSAEEAAELVENTDSN